MTQINNVYYGFTVPVWAGSSDETKPTKNVRNGSQFIETDTGKKYMFDEETGEWCEQPTGGGGLLPVIHVFTVDGAVVTAVNGSTEITAVSHIDHADIEIPNYGTWTLSATNRGVTSAQQAVSVDTVKEYSLTIEMAEIYGVTWDKTASTVLSRTDDAALFAEPVPYMNGMQPGDYHSPFDTIQPWAGMVRSTDETVGELVAIPKFYYKWTNTATTLSLQIATKPTEGFHVSPAHADRGDGKGERDIVYIGRYHCDADYKSKTGVKPKVNIACATARSGIHALGDDIWLNDFALFWTIRMLYLVEYADWNCQKTIGYGRGNGSAVENMGYTDNMPYHTGTTLSNRSTYGVSTQYRNIEGVWDNCVDWCDGIRFSGRNVYCFQKPSDCSDSSGGTLVFDARPTASDFISAWNVPNVNGFEWALYPSEVQGGEQTYVADKCYYDSFGVVLYVGGNYGQTQSCGMFYLHGSSSASGASGSIGSRLQKLP